MDSLGFGDIAAVLFPLLVAWLAVQWLYGKLMNRIRLTYIRNYKWPSGLSDRFLKHHPHLDGRQTVMVENALKQFFAAYLTGGRKRVSMPSQAADDLWHEFILCTRAYQGFCNKAFGRFLRHTPSVVLDPKQRADNEGLRRVWTRACALEGIDPVSPRGLPLLFEIDKKLNIRNGFHYYPNCDALRVGGAVAAVHCAAHFADAGVDGSLAGFGCEAGGDSGNGGSGSGDGCSGSGCGGD